MIDNFLALLPLVVARLQESLPKRVYVLSTDDLASITDSKQPAPAVHVVYEGYSPEKNGPGWEEVQIKLQTVVVVRNVAVLSNPALPAAAGGALMSLVVRSLRPWVPPLEGYGSLHLAPPFKAGFSTGFAYLPIGWRVTARMRTAPQR